MLERPHIRYELALFALLVLLFFAPHALAAKSMVSAGYHDTFVLDSNGTLKVTGLNHYGMLGNDSMDEVHTFTTLTTIENVAYATAGYYHSAAVKTDGTVHVKSCKQGLNLDYQPNFGFI